LERYRASQLFCYLKHYLSKPELKFIAENLTVYLHSEREDKYPLINKEDDLIVYAVPSVFCVTAAKHSLNLLRKVSIQMDKFVSNKFDIISKHFYFDNQIGFYYSFRNEGGLEDSINYCLKQIELSKDAIHEFRTKKIENSRLIKSYKDNIDDILSDTHKSKSADSLMKKYIKDYREWILELENFVPPPEKEYIGPEHTGFKRICIIYEKQGKYEEAIKYAEMAKNDHWGGTWDKRIVKLEKNI